MTIRERARGKAGSLLALALPTLAGLVYLTAGGAPDRYAIVNGGALTLALVWIAFGAAPASTLNRRVLIAVLLALLFLPLLTGPQVTDVARWVPLGPFKLHAGMLAVPALVMLAAAERDLAAPILLTATLAALLQPDAATALAVTCAAGALHDVTRDWKVGIAAILGFIATLLAAMRGELPAQPFAERVLHESFAVVPALSLVMIAAMIAGFLAMLMAIRAPKPQRYALAGSFFGFIAMSLMSNYPSPLIGYGAASILGIGFALGLTTSRKEIGHE